MKAEITPGKQQRFRQWFNRYGLLTVFVPAVVPFVPLPLKVFVISAGALHTPVGRFLVVILLARVIRYFGEAALGISLGTGAQEFLTHNAWSILGAVALVAFAVAGLMRLAARRNPPGQASRSL